MCMEKTLWEQTVDFHGHECIGLAAGYRIAEAAVNALQNGCGCGCGGDSNEEMVAVVENVSCSVDAVQFITGCTLGKRNFLIQNIGPGYIFTLPHKDKAVRVTLKEDWKARREEIMAHKKTGEEELLAAKMKSVIAEILSEPIEKVCRVEEVDYAVYQKDGIQKKGGKHMYGHHHKGHARRHGMEVSTCGCGCTDVCTCGCGCTDVCTCGCGCETPVPFSFQRLFYSKQEKIERLKDYLKNLEAEAKEVEKRLKRLEEDNK